MLFPGKFCGIIEKWKKENDCFLRYEEGLSMNQTLVIGSAVVDLSLIHI